MPASSPAAPYESGSSSSFLTAGSVTSSDTQILTSRQNRERLMLWNGSDVDVYVSFGSTCTTTDCSMKLKPDMYFIIEGYKGAVRAVVETGTESLWITEWV